MPSALASRIDKIEKLGGIKGRDVAQLLDTTPETISRWKTGKVFPQPERRNRLLTLEWLMSEMADLYEPEEARLWLFSHHRLLAGDRPADRIQNGNMEEVLALIEQLKTGAYV